MKNQDIVPIFQDDINFWTEQIVEHALFLYRLLHPIDAIEFKEKAGELYEFWFRANKEQPINYQGNLLNEFNSFLQIILDEISSGKIMNIEILPSDFEALVNHMLLEHIYYMELYEGKVTLDAELKFWIQESKEHTKLVSHLLPKSEVKEEMENLVEKFEKKETFPIKNLVDNLSNISESKFAALKIDIAIDDGKIRTVDKEMLEHEIRETMRGEDRIRFLLENK